MNLKLEIDVNSEKDKEFVQYLANCLEEWQKPEESTPEPTAVVGHNGAIYERQCEKCKKTVLSSHARGRFICKACREA